MLLTLDPNTIPICTAARLSGRQCPWGCRYGSCAVLRAYWEALTLIRVLRMEHAEGVRTRFITMTPAYDVSIDQFRRKYCPLYVQRLNDKGYSWKWSVSTLAFMPKSGRLHQHSVTAVGKVIPGEVQEDCGDASRPGSGRRVMGHVAIRDIASSHIAFRAGYLAFNALHFAVAHRGYADRVQPVSRSHSYPFKTSRGRGSRGGP